MKKFSKAPLSMTMGMVMSASLVTSAVQADVSPFKLSELSQANMQLAAVVPVDKPATPKSNAPAEMACGAMMKDKSGEKMDGMKGSGEMTCGAMMKDKSGGKMVDMKGTGEMACGAMMKDGMSDEKKAHCMKMMKENMSSHQ